MLIPSIGRAPGAITRYTQLLKLMGICDRIETKGWRVDRDQIKQLRDAALKRVDGFTESFLHATGLPRKALGSGGGSTHAVRDWFWLDQGAPHVVFNKLTRAPQFSTEALIIYANDYRDKAYSAAAAQLYALRKNIKALQFLDTYEHLSRDDGRIHFSFNPAGTQTGRWTSSTRRRVTLEDGTRATFSANAQQVPKKVPRFDFGSGPEPLVDSLRSVFIADPDCLLIAADYSALELRLIAYVYGAQKLIQWIDEGADVHTLNARAVFCELDLDDRDKHLKKAARDCAKTMAYAVSYQMHDEQGGGRYPTLFKALKSAMPSCTEQQANLYAKRFFELHPEIKRGQSVVRDRVRDLGYNELSIDGRRLYYPSTMRGYNQALNFPMQGTGGQLINRAIVALNDKIDWQLTQVRAQVHDELVVQVPAAAAADVAKEIRRCMTQPAQIGATYTGIPVELQAGSSWGSLAALA